MYESLEKEPPNARTPTQNLEGVQKNLPGFVSLSLEH